MFSPMNIRSNLASHFFQRGPALPSAWTSNDAKFGNETAMRFDRVERVATARAYHGNFLQVYREFFDEKPVLLWLLGGGLHPRRQMWYRDRVWVQETQRHACISPKTFLVILLSLIT